MSRRLAALLAGAVLGLAACDMGGGEAESAGEQRPPEVTVATPLVKELVEWDEFTGRFAAIQRVEIRPRVNGYIDRIAFSDGSVVEAGQLLFVIDPEPFEVALERAKASVADAEARLELARVEEQRAGELVGRGNIAEATYDERLAELEAARAALASANAAVRQAEIDLAYTEIRSPFAGRISASEVDTGSLVLADGGMPTHLTTVISRDPIHFVFDLSEAEYLAYQRAADRGEMLANRDGQTPAEIRLSDEAGWPHEGHLDFVDVELASESATIRARVEAANADGLFTPGLFARVRIPGTPLYPAILIPDQAITAQQASRIVYVVDDANVVEQREVRLGPREFGLRVVRSGLEPGERIVIEGLTRARPGQPVTPVEGDIEPDAEQG